MPAYTYRAKGARSLQEDHTDAGPLPPEWSHLSPIQSARVLVKTNNDLAKALLLDEDNQPCVEDIDSRASFSGSTLVAVLGQTWVSVGDSLLLQATIDKDNQVHLKLVNPLHTLNRHELKLIRQRLKENRIHKTIKELVTYNNITEQGRGRIAGLEMTHALGDFEAQKNLLITHAPALGQFTPTLDKRFIIVASDGLFDFTPPHHQQFQDRYAKAEATYQASAKSEEDYLQKLDTYDQIDADKHDEMLKLFETEINKHLAGQEISVAGVGEALTDIITGYDINNDNTTFTISDEGWMFLADGHGGAVKTPSESSTYIAEHFKTKLEQNLTRYLGEQENASANASAQASPVISHKSATIAPTVSFTVPSEVPIPEPKVRPAPEITGKNNTFS